MTGRLARRGAVVWLAIIAAETVHGTLRQLFLAPAIGDFRARQISVFTGTVLIFCVTALLARWMGAARPRDQWTIGCAWVVLTVAFEIGLGVALGYPPERLLADYDLRHGGLMGFGLAALAAMPWLTARWRGVGVAAGVSHAD